jgi:hypothetical protein
MLAIGCIQAQRCHTDHCPTGVATQNRWLTRGIDPTLKSERLANYVKTLRRDLLKLAEACGVEHPALIDADMIELLDRGQSTGTLRDVAGYAPHWGQVGPEDRAELRRIMTATAPVGNAAPASDSCS